MSMVAFYEVSIGKLPPTNETNIWLIFENLSKCNFDCTWFLTKKEHSNVFIKQFSTNYIIILLHFYGLFNNRTWEKEILSTSRKVPFCRKFGNFLVKPLNMKNDATTPHHNDDHTTPPCDIYKWSGLRMIVYLKLKAIFKCLFCLYLTNFLKSLSLLSSFVYPQRTGTSTMVPIIKRLEQPQR